MRKYLLISVFLLLAASGEAMQSLQPTISGLVLDYESRKPIPGVNVVIKGTLTGTVTDTEGRFEIEKTAADLTLVFSFIGYEATEIVVQGSSLKPLTVLLSEDIQNLNEVQVLSTGFQDLPAERATGSFVQIDESLINRRVSTSVINRIEDVTPGLIFNRDRPDLTAGESISIRGNSTLLGDRRPLIVVDNLAYDGPIENLNPNDVESITVLRDAAAASIWGARAGNGVIVIKTKRGSFEQPFRLQWNSNLTTEQRFNPFYLPQMDISDFVDVESRLFEQGVFAGQEEGYGNPKLSPVVENQIAFRDGKISRAEFDSRMLGYKTRDVRNELYQYFYRPAFRQQYSVQLSGGSQNYSYSIGLGFDNNQETKVNSGNERVTLSLQQNWKAFKNKLNFGLGTYLIQSNSYSSFPIVEGLEPYDLLVGENGESLPVFWEYSSRFKQNLEGTGIQDWDYYPYEELGLRPETRSLNEIRINPRLDWKIAKGFSLSSNYQYYSAGTNDERIYSTQSYFSRDLINQFTEINSPGNVVNRIPLGTVYDFGSDRAYSHNWRNQLNYSGTRGSHEFNALIGNEVKHFQRDGKSGRAYGYDEETGISQLVDPLSFYPDLTTGFTAQIPFRQSFSGNINRFISYFTNAGYTYKGKYLLTGSARLDGSNLYGVATNNKIVPLWSAGLGWIVTEESWMNWEPLDFLKIKLSYGFNGNTNSSATAFTTASYFSAGSNRWVGQPWLSVLNPPNPTLRWEKIKIINLGTEFEMLDGKLQGGLEFYAKEGIDLYGSQPSYPSSGVSTITRNYANTRTKGIDFNLSGKIISGTINWGADFFYSYLSEQVTNYGFDPLPANVAIYSSGLSGISPAPVEGFPLYSIFSFPFAGLDASNGNPLGIYNSEPSNNYSGILSETKMEDLIYHGSSTPTHFGALRNRLDWKGFELSFNISYRLGYYFRRESIIYDNLNRGEIGHSDYELRWKKSGDELLTSVPSDPLVANPQRTTFDLISSRSVRKGDHIRFQDIQFSYTFHPRVMASKSGSEIRLYGYVNNVGILWKAAKDVRDPDYRNFQAPSSFSIGLSFNY